MSLFSSISDSFEIPDSELISDDNAGLNAEQNNPIISAGILGMRTAYDGLHAGFSYVIQGKRASLQQLEKYIDNWIAVLDRIVEKYKEMLGKLDDLGADLSGELTLDFAKEAWEIIQDTPILRRYLGEANYWYLYDTLGLLATQTAGLTADVILGLKNVIKQAILAVISSTDGLISLQSYMAYLQSAWGFLYVKGFSHITLDSVLPQVTTAYWYKPTHMSISRGNTHAMALNNNPPGKGFVPLPVPIPNPVMIARNPSYVTRFDYQNPDTWYLDGEPYYMPNTMSLLKKALEYWGSSYTDAINAPNIFYSRRSYEIGGVAQEKPLQIGSTLHQLDTDKMSINGTNTIQGNDSTVSTYDVLNSVFTPGMVVAMDEWQTAYEEAYGKMLDYIFSWKESYPNIPINRLDDFQRAAEPQYSKWFNGNQDTRAIVPAVNALIRAWCKMLWQYSIDQGSTRIGEFETVEDFMNSGRADYTGLFDSIMRTLVYVGKNSSGYLGSLTSEETFMVCSSYDPSNEYLERYSEFGVPYIAYRVNQNSGVVRDISGNAPATVSGSVVNAEYTPESIAFVMFPSNRTSPEMFRKRCLFFSPTPNTLLSTLTNVPVGLEVGSTVTDGVLNEFVYPQIGDTIVSRPLGPIPNTLCLHKSCGMGSAVVLNPENPMAPIFQVGNLFFPSGILPESRESAIMPETFVTVYRGYSNIRSSSNELAEVVGYAINRGREAKFPCFGIYGNLITMASWNYKEMAYDVFMSRYSQIKSGSRLYYDVGNPSKVIMYHSSYTSQSRGIVIAVYHEYVAREMKSYGPNDKYNYYVFPGESISVTRLPTSGINGYNLGMLLSADATGINGERYHYDIIKNPIPLCPKYVDPKEWSFMDIVYELLLLANNLSGLCGDNGKRLHQLERDLSDFGITVPKFLGELPENNGQYVDFKFNILAEYAAKIEKAVDSVYEFRSKLIEATVAW